MQWPGTAAVLEDIVLESTELENTELENTELENTELDDVLASAQSSLELPCRDDPELFFAESPEDVEFAKSLCTGCPARLACLAGALERREPWGVWGGEVFQRGEVVPYKRPRGRPRKSTVAA